MAHKHDKKAAKDKGVTTSLTPRLRAAHADSSTPMTNKDYEREMRRLHGELVAMQEWVKATGARVCIVFEGRDTAGKGGTIKRITERVSPRVFKVVALSAPTDREKSQMYIQRYIPHFPAAGEVVIFDRSWYNRAGVELVMGFCTPEQTERFLEQVPAVEKAMVDSGIILLKYWLEVSPEEQTRRLEGRINDPRKIWKLTDMDLKSYGRWYDYSRARDAMFGGDGHPVGALVPRADRRQEARPAQHHQPSPEPGPVRPGSSLGTSCCRSARRPASTSDRNSRCGSSRRRSSGDVLTDHGDLSESGRPNARFRTAPQWTAARPSPGGHIDEGAHMRRFIVEVLLDAVLLLFIVLLLGIISVGQPFPFGPTSVPILSLRGAGIIGFVSWAAVLVLVNRFARPVLVALTGRLLFSTMGFFVVIINAVAIYITSFFAPIKIADVAQPTLLWVIVAAALYTAFSTVMDAVLGLNRPDLGADRSRGIWGFLESLPTPRRNAILENLRLQQVYNAIYSTSLDIALADTPIGPIRRWFARVVLGDKDVLDEATGPERIVAMLEQAGPTYVKIGQMMASRADILPANWITERSKLQSEAAPFGYDDVVTIVTKELGAPPEELYETFDPIPFAAASTAQVHEARLHDGTLVAVKVQRAIRTGRAG